MDGGKLSNIGWSSVLQDQIKLQAVSSLVSPVEALDKEQSLIVFQSH
jgi:hypothetical protein